ncbi:hypothetical protein E1193_29265 [Micromonospora sp. KC606]|uniref:hypothetical protein n=1 Tax=Micromonospora sp. KC606 TaxID=2530379 RepID=UPI001048A634|nr:hypothetical protein [Micromonospora sp. KC606]TDC71143.1 hypothetical protein E1193_29265 [Micromonospora sp. KC606]
MANKMLGKVVAGAALGGASLLVLTPGMAIADGTHHRGDREGRVHAKPHVAKPGETVKFLEVCPHPQEHAYVWSKVTGKVKLKPAEESGGEHRDWKGKESGGEHRDWKGKESGGEHRDWKGKESGGEHRDWKGKDEGSREKDKGGRQGRDEHRKSPTPQPPANGGQPNGTGGGFVADAGAERDRKAHEEQGAEERGGQHEREWKGQDWRAEEHDQAAESESERGHGSEDHRYGTGSERGSEGREHSWKTGEHDRAADSERGHGSEGRENGQRGHGSEGRENGQRGHGSEGRENGERGHGSEGRENGERGGKNEDRGTGTGSERGGKSHGGYEDDAAGEEHGWKHKKDFVYYGEGRVASDAAPGRYELKGSCGEGELVVLPRGHVEGGDGGMTTGADGGMALGGASMIGAAALGGIVLMRRRRADGLV